MKSSPIKYLWTIMFLPAPLFAATFNVADETQLFNAITTANSNAEPDTITVAAGAITLTSDLPTILADGGNDLTIEGVGMGATIIEAGDLPQELGGTGTHNRRVFNVNGATVVFRDLTVRRGRISGTGVYGGNIRATNSANTTLERVEIAEGAIVDTSTAYGGGGISSVGTLIILDSIIQSNLTTTSASSGGNSGAGIHAGGTSLQMSRTTVQGNTTSSKSDAAGLWANAPTTIDQCTFVNNDAGSKSGGAIRSEASSVLIQRSTFSGNNGALGGAIYARGATTFESCTITNNNAGGQGGGVGRNTTSPIIFRNCIIAGNTRGGSTPNDIGFGSGSNLISEGNNIIGALGSGITVSNTQASDSIGSEGTPVDAMLGPLQNNGGPTLTHALLGGSPAIDAGTDQLIAGGTFTNDQRGASRVIEGVADIGAVERDITAPIMLGVTASDPTAVGTAYGEFVFAEDNVIITAKVYAREYTSTDPWAEVTGTVDPVAGTWSATLPGDGLYDVMIHVVNFDGYPSVVPSGTASYFQATKIVYNDTENSAFTRTGMTGGNYAFPLTAALDVILSFSNGTIGASATISRTTGDNAPPMLDASRLLDEYLTITGTIPPSRSATITWNYDGANAAGLVGTLNSVYQIESGVLQNTYPVTPSGDSISIGPISSFSDWYAGDGSASVASWELLDNE